MGGRDGFGPAPPRMFVKTLGFGGTAAGRTPAYGLFDRANALADFDPRRWSWGAAYGDQSRIVGNADLQTTI
jgi:hypothetical protein